jgi:hypothetical protein
MDNAAVLPTNLVFSAFICCSLEFPESANMYITDSSTLSFASNIKRLSPTTLEFSAHSVGVFVTTYNNLSLQINCWRYEFLICGQAGDQDHSGMTFSWSCNLFSNVFHNNLLCIFKCLFLWGFDPASQLVLTILSLWGFQVFEEKIILTWEGAFIYRTPKVTPCQIPISHSLQRAEVWYVKRTMSSPDSVFGIISVFHWWCICQAFCTWRKMHSTDFGIKYLAR